MSAAATPELLADGQAELYTPVPLGTPISPPPLPPEAGADYFDAPPGDSTKLFMATAGIYKRRRQQRIAAIVGSIVFVLFASIIALDIAGVITIPGMGLVYDVTGLADPNADRARERVSAKLEDKDLTPKERARLEALRRKLIGGEPRRRRAGRNGRRGAAAADAVTEGVVERGEMTAQKRDLARDVFGDSRKRDAGIKLSKPESIQTPNLPEGLTQQAIFEVISENSGSMRLCFAQAMRKGEKLGGRMEVALTINAAGRVTDARIETPRFRPTVMGSCTIRRVKSWRFPSFNGEPVTVIYPYVLESGF